MNHFGVYIHIPFCLGKCPYCDFYSLPYREGDMSRLVRALLSEGEMARRSLSIPGEVDSWYVGGGTPSRLPAELLDELVGGLAGAFPLSGDGESTVEANPEDITLAFLEKITRLGFTRLSLGVQSLRPRILSALGRRTSRQKNLYALELVKDKWKGSLSVDLIYGLAEGGLSGWLADLEEALQFSPQHISAYELTLEAGSPLEGLKGEDELCREMFLTNHRLLEERGYEHYEISNYALPQSLSKHNMNYWLGGEYLGLGPSSASFIGGERFGNPPDLDRYLSDVFRGSPPTCWRERLAGDRRGREALILALRLGEGVEMDEFSRVHEIDIEGMVNRELAPYFESGLVEIEDGRLRLTLEGMLLSDDVFGGIV